MSVHTNATRELNLRSKAAQRSRRSRTRDDDTFDGLPPEVDSYMRSSRRGRIFRDDNDGESFNLARELSRLAFGS